MRLDDIEAASAMKKAADQQWKQQENLAASQAQQNCQYNRIGGGIIGAAGSGDIGVLHPAIIQQTEALLQRATQEVQRLEELLRLLVSHPEIERILELLERGRGY